jgi:hypothetical protein
MTKRIWFAWAVLGLFGAACPSPTFAKPGDLPVDVDQQCPDARETTRSIHTEGSDDRFATGLPPRADVAPATGTRWTTRGLAPRPTHELRDGCPEPTITHDVEAEQLFSFAEQCHRRGESSRARVFYEEVYLLSPESASGRLALERLREVEREQLGDAEETEDAEPPASEREAGTPRNSGTQAGEGAPTRNPQLPPLPLDHRYREMLERYREILESTVPLGGAEEADVRDLFEAVKEQHSSAIFMYPAEPVPLATLVSIPIPDLTRLRTAGDERAVKDVPLLRYTLLSREQIDLEALEWPRPIPQPPDFAEFWYWHAQW